MSKPTDKLPLAGKIYFTLLGLMLVTIIVLLIKLGIAIYHGNWV